MDINIKEIVDEAKAAAAKATADFLAKYGDRDACGFAWVNIYEKGSTKLGRALISAGFSKAYGGGLQMWNPSNNNTQSISAKEAGADAAVAVFRNRIPGIKVYSGSRMD